MSHHQIGEDAQNIRNVLYSRIAIPRTVRFLSILYVVTSYKDLTDFRNWDLLESIKHIVTHPDTDNANVSQPQTGEDTQNERKFTSVKIAITNPVQIRRIL